MKRRNFFAALAAPLVAPAVALKPPDPPVEHYVFGWAGFKFVEPPALPAYVGRFIKYVERDVRRLA